MSITTATEKLQNELKKARQAGLTKPVIEYLIGRIKESESFADDVDQPHKTWEKCEKYILDKAANYLGRKNGAIPKEIVYEWAEDYYHLDDKAAAEKEAAEKAERAAKAKKQAEERKAKMQSLPKEAEAKKTESKPVAEITEMKKPEPKKDKGTIDGQMDIMSFLGI